MTLWWHARTSVDDVIIVMVLTLNVYDKWDLVLNEEEFQFPALSQCGEMTENGYILV